MKYSYILPIKKKVGSAIAWEGVGADKKVMDELGASGADSVFYSLIMMGMMWVCSSKLTKLYNELGALYCM